MRIRCTWWMLNDLFWFQFKSYGFHLSQLLRVSWFLSFVSIVGRLVWDYESIHTIFCLFLVSFTITATPFASSRFIAKAGVTLFSSESESQQASCELLVSHWCIIGAVALRQAVTTGKEENDPGWFLDVARSSFRENNRLNRDVVK